MIVFLDAPALLACYALCAESAGILRAARREEQLAVSARVDLEFAGLLLRMVRRGAGGLDAERILARRQADARGFLRVPTDPQVGEAALLAARHGLSCAQATDLAAALELSGRLKEQLPTLEASPVLFLCISPGLRAAARAEGLQTL